ncbi:MAG TPA: TraR/DksA C4-type zinc finger protein [Kofleriaceae bacterium]|nr:TraR/DksA C4-type zinc finger protein [Kofleriaceae bacterium]
MVKKNMTQLARKALLRHGRDLLKQRGKVRPNAFLDGLSDDQRHELEEVHAALERIERGIFGTCEGCGTRISEARIALVPYLRTCDTCAETQPAAIPPALPA